MSTYRYIVYCENEGPTPSNPLRPFYTEDEILQNLHNFELQANCCFNNEAAVEITNVVEIGHDVPLPAIMIAIRSAEDNEVIAQAMHCSLQGLDLFARKI